MDTFVQQLINGLNVGAIYALIALGYTMVYGILRLINFAHGDIYMVGAFAGYFIALKLGLARSVVGRPGGGADRLDDHRSAGRHGDRALCLSSGEKIRAHDDADYRHRRFALARESLCRLVRRQRRGFPQLLTGRRLPSLWQRRDLEITDLNLCRFDRC